MISYRLPKRYCKGNYIFVNFCHPPLNNVNTPKKGRHAHQKQLSAATPQVGTDTVSKKNKQDLGTYQSEGQS
jgi:hypothetical protein